MSILKLNPGDRVQFTVSRTEEVQGKFGPQIKFVGVTPDDADAAVFLNVDTADKQLGRIGHSTASVIGQTVEFERIEKNGTKYTNINRVATGAAKPAAPQKAAYSSGPAHIEGLDAPDAEHPALPHERLDRVLALHDACVNHAIAVTAKKLMEAGITPLASDVLAAAATQMIGAQKAGVA